MACRLNPGIDLRFNCCRAAFALHIAIEVCNSPCFRLGDTAETRDEMQMEMAGSLTKGDRVHAIATAGLLNQERGPLHDEAPFRRFHSTEIKGTSAVASGIEQTPTREGAGMGMVTQQPVLAPPDLELRKGGIIVMNAADTASRGKRLNRLAHSHSSHQTQ